MPPPKLRATEKKTANLAAVTSVITTADKVASAKTHSICSQTEALSRMTIELNMRAINFQAQRLEHDLGLLVKSTEQDKEFLLQHKLRMDDIWKELLAVKIKVNEVQGGQEDASVRYERCRQETTDSIEEFRKQIGEFQTLCSDLSTQLESLPTMADLDLVATQPLPDDSRQRSLHPVSNMAIPPSAQRQGRLRAFVCLHTSLTDDCGTESITDPTQNICRDIDDVISSTRRWNREHKTTNKSDATFVADYLRRQSRRNTRLAVHIQKGIRRRVRLRLADSDIRPKSLEEFCQVVTWNDVLEVVEEVLVNSVEDVVKALS